MGFEEDFKDFLIEESFENRSCNTKCINIRPDYYSIEEFETLQKQCLHYMENNIKNFQFRLRIDISSSEIGFDEFGKLREYKTAKEYIIPVPNDFKNGQLSKNFINKYFNKDFKNMFELEKKDYCYNSKHILHVLYFELIILKPPSLNIDDLYELYKKKIYKD